MDNKTKIENLVNSLIYSQLTSKYPSRFEMVRYTTWRIYAYNQLDLVSEDLYQTSSQKQLWKNDLFKKLSTSQEKKQFYDFLYSPKESSLEAMRADNISHFICRMLYCQQQPTQIKFVSTQKRILRQRILAKIGFINKIADQTNVMNLLKHILAQLKKKNASDYNINPEQWNHMSEQINFSGNSMTNKSQEQKNAQINCFAKLSFEDASQGIKKRRSFIYKGYVYVDYYSMLDIVLANYENYLKDKFATTRSFVTKIISQDSQNQFAVFLIKTISQIYDECMEQIKITSSINLNLMNIEMFSRKYFPPCMMNLNQHLKKSRHLKHDGRRQLWTFFKACGMDVHDNKQYFRRNFQGNMTATEMKGHMYNIQHSYGLQGHRKRQNAWSCRNIIPQIPKKDQYHGCPFASWRPGELKDFLRANYHISENKLQQIMEINNNKHFQIACGRLFEYSEYNNYQGQLPSEITAKLGRAPHLFFQAAMDVQSYKQNKQKKTKHNMPYTASKQESKSNIDF